MRGNETGFVIGYEADAVRSAVLNAHVDMQMQMQVDRAVSQVVGHLTVFKQGPVYLLNDHVRW